MVTLKMTNGDITNELRRMVEGKQLDGDEALRLLLVMVGQIQVDISSMASSHASDIAELKVQQEANRQRLDEIDRRNERWPSMLYLWQTNRRAVIFYITVTLVIYSLVASPWLISDIRHALLHMVGLPTDLGIPIP